MSLPALLVAAVVVVYPMGYALFVSFTPFHLLRPEQTFVFEWSGMFDNYVRLMGDDVFWKSLRHTIVFLAVTVNHFVYRFPGGDPCFCNLG